MNIRNVLFILGKVAKAEGGFLLLPMICSLCYQEYDVAKVYLMCAAFCTLIGLILERFRLKQTKILSREGMVAVGLSWCLISALGCLPFIFTGEIPNPVDAFFETVSGFTTTGSTIIPDLSTISMEVYSGAHSPTGLAGWESWYFY